MLKKWTAVTLIIILVAFSMALAKENMDFSGDWVLDKKLSKMPDGNIQISKIKITQDGDKIATRRTYANEYGEEYPFAEDLTLGGDELEHFIYDMPRKAAAKWSEDKKNIVFESTTTFSGDSGEVDFVAKEKWSMDNKIETFTIEFTSSTPHGELQGTAVFKKSAPKAQ